MVLFAAARRTAADAQARLPRRRRVWCQRLPEMLVQRSQPVSWGGVETAAVPVGKHLVGPPWNDAERDDDVRPGEDGPLGIDGTKQHPQVAKPPDQVAAVRGRTEPPDTSPSGRPRQRQRPLRLELRRELQDRGLVRPSLRPSIWWVRAR
jgi:hypothetical protein